MLTNSPRQGWPELLDPSQDRPPTDIDTTIREDASDALGCGTQLEVVPNSEQDDVRREAMT